MAGALLMALASTDLSAQTLRDEIASTGKLRVAIAISPAGGAFWSTMKSEGVYAGVPVSLGTAMAGELNVPVEFVVHQNSGQITDAAAKGTWDVAFLPQDIERMSKMAFGPIYEVADATYLVKPGSAVSTFAELDREGTNVAAVNNTTTMRAQSHI
jgi:polar amino acid transport system substrate-binding protein